MSEIDAGDPTLPTTVNASPTKQFFVNMLVRDIELKDTLLDLLDNCVDGILRSQNPDLNSATPYAGFRADLVLSPDCFLIQDNCGGIPVKIAETSAFAIGKPVPIAGADAVATVGMYGIGMKRAIFKIGTDATVDSWNDQPFRVRISPEWLEMQDWQPLPMSPLPAGELQRGETRIVIKGLNSAVRTEFESSDFFDELVADISENYALIIEKGFSVTVRRDETAAIPEPIRARSFSLLRQLAITADHPAIAPYVYVGELDGVHVEIYAGLYRRLPSEDEREREEETRGVTDDAGWTIACNDRVVIWKDRTRLTGWGEASVPNYHGQFIAITGIVLLRSEDPKRLPLTTTKRGIDAGSEIYSKVKDMMRESTKGLTTFTNKWKKFEDDLDVLYRNTEYISLRELRSQATTVTERAYHKFPSISRYVPSLPTPRAEITSARISFIADKADVARLSTAYFGDPAAKPKEVGQEAFKREAALYAEAAE